MKASLEQIRAFRLKNHHLDRPLPLSRLDEAAGACGVQNSPPGAWETALWNRVEGVTPPVLQAALYQEKTLLQAWSIRGVPLVFPTADAGVFLTPLCAQEGEAPGIYTRGITGALDALGMSFYDLLPWWMRPVPVWTGRPSRARRPWTGGCPPWWSPCCRSV